MAITASLLYDFVQCPHRVIMDLGGDPELRDPVSPFLQLLWERGNAFEAEVVAGLDRPCLDLSRYSGPERARQTTAAMARREPLIYRGRIAAGDLLGDPDLLRLEESGYVPIDIKSGTGDEGPEDQAKPKLHYAVQLGLYLDILEQLGQSAGRRGYIWDIHRDEVLYDFSQPRGPKSPGTLWDDYQGILEQVRALLANAGASRAAYGATCKGCHWYSVCLKQVRQDDDLTLIPQLGRSKRDVLVSRIPTVRHLAEADLTQFGDRKRTVFPRISLDTLAVYQNRARLLAGLRPPNPYLKSPLALPATDLEIFFDIEVDPMRDVCYLHGFIERRGRDNAGERYLAFYADDPHPEAEERAFRQAWAYLQSLPEAAIYYYSKYERTIWRKLQAKYPQVCGSGDLEALFTPPRSVDLYFDAVFSKTEWPTNDFSIKTLATHLGFHWRDTHPSGAASIEWYHRWVESRDPAVKQRILDYNEDDCRATRVLLDGLRQLSVEK